MKNPHWGNQQSLSIAIMLLVRRRRLVFKSLVQFFWPNLADHNRNQLPTFQIQSNWQLDHKKPVETGYLQSKSIYTTFSHNSQKKLEIFK